MSPAQTVGSLTEVFADVSKAVLAFYRWLEEAAHNAEKKHLRAERLAAYQVRHSWKASDIRPLLSIGVSQRAQRRLATVKGKGRPIVKMHRSLEDVLSDRLTSWSNILREDATPAERRRSFRDWPWWKYHVEALYRGELDRARENGISGPSDYAERAVAHALGMSQGVIHRICGEIRAQRREDPEPADFAPMVLADYERWMEHNVFPIV